jgi:hypothetical protein
MYTRSVPESRTKSTKASGSKKKGNASAPKKAVQMVERRPDAHAEMLAKVETILDGFFRDRLVSFLKGYGSLLIRQSAECPVTVEQSKVISILEDVLLPLLDTVELPEGDILRTLLQTWKEEIGKTILKAREYGVTEGPQG